MTDDNLTSIFSDDKVSAGGEPMPKLTEYKCKKCGRVWVPREAKPKKCPTCKNEHWDKPYERKNSRRTAQAA